MLAFIVPRAIEIDIMGNRNMTMISISTEKMWPRRKDVRECPEMSGNVRRCPLHVRGLLCYNVSCKGRLDSPKEKAGKIGTKREEKGY